MLKDALNLLYLSIGGVFDCLHAEYLTLRIQLITIITSVTLYLINAFIIKCVYKQKRFRIQEILFFCLPYMNLCFLMTNLSALYLGLPQFLRKIKPVPKAKIDYSKKKQPKEKTDTKPVPQTTKPVPSK